MKLFLAALVVVALAGASLFYEWTLYRAVVAGIERGQPSLQEPEAVALRVARDRE